MGLPDYPLFPVDQLQKFQNIILLELSPATKYILLPETLSSLRKAVSQGKKDFQQKCKMRCITYHPPCISSIITCGKINQHLNSTTSVRHPCTSKPAGNLQQRNGLNSSFTIRTAPDTLVIAATSQPYSGDLPVLFQTSAVMLFMYWIANFVVPYFVMKDLQGDNNEDADAKKDDENLPDIGQGSAPRRTAGSGTKKKGFGNTK